MDQYFIYKKNSLINVLKKEYIALSNTGKLVSYQHPQFAQIFNSFKEAEDFVDSYIANEIVHYGTIKELEDDLSTFEDWIKSGCFYRSYPLLNKRFSKPYNNESPKKILEFHTEYVKKDNIQLEALYTWPELQETFDCIFTVYNDNNDKYLFDMRVMPDTPFSTFEQELALVTSFVNSRNSRYPDAICISIVTISIEDSYYFYIFDNGQYGIGGQNIQKFDSLQECFNVWKNDFSYNLDD